jgi:hypothetical protein
MDRHESTGRGLSVGSYVKRHWCTFANLWLAVSKLDKVFWRVLLVLGLSIFLLVGFSGAFVCNEYLHYPSAWGGQFDFLN